MNRDERLYEITVYAAAALLLAVALWGHAAIRVHPMQRAPRRVEACVDIDLVPWRDREPVKPTRRRAWRRVSA